MSDFRNALQKGAANVINGHANQLRIQIEENDVLRAHLAAEQGVIAQYRVAVAEIAAERDALRALLKEAQDDPDWHSLKGGLRARIDAALGGQGDG